MKFNSQKHFFIQRIINLFHHHTDQTWISFDELSLLFETTYNLNLSLTITIELILDLFCTPYPARILIKSRF
jgi:hypothetical protein